MTLLFSYASAFAQENLEMQEVANDKTQKVSFMFEFLNNSLNFGFNAEYSPNNYLDFGIGYSPYILILPASEIHAYARAYFLDFPVQPFVQISAALGIPSTMEDDASLFNMRCGAGVKFNFGKYIYCGFGGTYCFIGQDWIDSEWKGFCPSAFVGCTAFRF